MAVKAATTGCVFERRTGQCAIVSVQQKTSTFYRHWKRDYRAATETVKTQYFAPRCWARLIP